MGESSREIDSGLRLKPSRLDSWSYVALVRLFPRHFSACSLLLPYSSLYTLSSPLGFSWTLRPCHIFLPTVTCRSHLVSNSVIVGWTTSQFFCPSVIGCDQDLDSTMDRKKEYPLRV